MTSMNEENSGQVNINTAFSRLGDAMVPEKLTVQHMKICHYIYYQCLDTVVCIRNIGSFDSLQCLTFIYSKEDISCT